MKVFGLVLGLVFSQAAMAYPMTGDQVQFRQADGSMLEILNKGLDSGNHVWLVQVTEGSKVSVEKWNEADMPTQKEILSVVKNCVQDAGVKETITVPAGTFETCKFSNDSGGFTWVGDVPFSMIKVDTTSLKLELVKFNSAK